MAENYKLNKVMDSMKRDAVVGRSFNLEKKASIIKNVLIEKHITTDPSKLPNYKKEELLSAINKEKELGYYDKKAFRTAYGEGKAERSKPFARTSASGRESAVDRKHSAAIGNVPRQPAAPSFLVSNNNVRAAQGLMSGANIKKNDNFKQNSQSSDGGGDIVKNRLKEIQA